MRGSTHIHFFDNNSVSQPQDSTSSTPTIEYSIRGSTHLHILENNSSSFQPHKSMSQYNGKKGLKHTEPILNPVYVNNEDTSRPHANSSNS